METIHQRIRRLRKAKSLSIQDIATKCGVANQSARQWELPEPKNESDPAPTEPRPKYRQKLAEILGVSVSELMCGDDAASTRKQPDPTPSVEAIAHKWKRFREEVTEKLDEFSAALAMATAEKHLKRFQRKPTPRRQKAKT